MLIPRNAFSLCLLILGSLAHAQDIDESELFGDPNLVVVPPPTDSNPPPPETGLRSCGEIQSTATVMAMRTGDMPDLQFQQTGTLFLDARSESNYKAFAALEGTVANDSTLNSYHLRELFLDFSLMDRVYFRLGKQVLQWSRTYFFHPADLVNVEQKSFVERAGTLEGVQGIRTHIPFGTRANLYAFVNADDANTVQDLDYAGKAEALLGGTEVSIGAWKSSGLNPVYSMDFSSGLWDWDIAGEVSLHPNGFTELFEIVHDTLFVHTNQDWTPRVCFSFGSTFDFGAYTDRIRLQLEYYYNGLGYDYALLEDMQEYPWAQSVDFIGTSIRKGPMSTWLLAKGKAIPLTTARHYGAFFSSFSHFFISDLTLSVNGILNAIDASYLFSTTLQYTTLHNLDFALTVLSLGGPFPGELNFSGQRISTQVIATFRF